MIVWSGFGWAVLFAPALFGVFAELALAALVPGGPVAGRHNTAFVIGLLAAAVLWPVGRLVHADGRPPFDPATGRENLPLPKHTLFWIPVEYWGVIFPAIGLGTVLKG